MKIRTIRPISNSFKSADGFTLLEILIVLTIIMVLVSFSVPSYQRYVKRAEAVAIVNVLEPFVLAHQTLLQTHGTRADGTSQVIFLANKTDGSASYCIRASGNHCVPNTTQVFYSAEQLIVPGSSLAISEAGCYIRCANFSIKVESTAPSREAKIAENPLLYEFAQIMEPNVERVSYSFCETTTNWCHVSIRY